LKRIVCHIFLLSIGHFCFAQTGYADSALNESYGIIYYPIEFSLMDFYSNSILLSSENEQDQSIFTNAPQWVRDLRRAEIVLFGTLPFTIFFTRTFMDLYRTASHDWDRRYAPWPFTAAGAVSMTNDEIKIMFAIAVSASLVISIADYLLVSRKRKAAAAPVIYE